MTLDLGSIVGHLGGYFNRRGIEWAVTGGLALGAHGISRTTFDVDVVVALDHQDELLAFLETLGFETLHRSRGYSNHIHPENGRVDVIYVGRDTATQLFDETSNRDVLGRTVPVPKAEHLIAMKLVAYRNDPSRRLQDLADIRSLVQSASLDRDTVRAVFAHYGLEEDADHVS